MLLGGPELSQEHTSWYSVAGVREAWRNRNYKDYEIGVAVAKLKWQAQIH